MKPRGRVTRMRKSEYFPEALPCAGGDSVVISVYVEIRVVPVSQSTLAQVLLWSTFPSADRV